MTMQVYRQAETGHRKVAGPVPSLRDDWALFLDFDGTLVDLGDDPHRTALDADMRAAVAAAHRFLGGALALVSGRPLDQIDERFGPEHLAAAGLHGLQRRSAQGVLHSSAATRVLRRVARSLREAFAGEPRIFIEDKGAALAVHYRLLREASGVVRQAVDTAARSLGPGYRVLAGADVFELLPTHANKGSAVRAFMTEAPFAGRVPVFVGDDVTDLDGFEAARQLGGLGIAVGERVAAEYRLADVPAVCRWLQATRK